MSSDDMTTVGRLELAYAGAEGIRVTVTTLSGEPLAVATIANVHIPKTPGHRSVALLMAPRLRMTEGLRLT